MRMEQLTHGALFNGIAGFPLAAAWAGIPTIWTVEIDEFCNQVSKKHFPDATQYTDIHHATNLPYVDIISGGFPCQPFSVAGKQLGNEDDRALWPEMLRIIREVKPAYVIGENVAGLINMALDDVLASLEAEGYTTETFVVPACAVNAPHRRDRLWIIGYTQHNGQPAAEIRQSLPARNGGGKAGKGKSQQSTRPSTPEPVATSNTDSFGQQGQGRPINTSNKTPDRDWQECRTFDDLRWQLVPPVCGGNYGVSRKLDQSRLKALGNAIVPQVAYQIFKAIQQLAA